MKSLTSILSGPLAAWSPCGLEERGSTAAPSRASIILALIVLSLVAAGPVLAQTRVVIEDVLIDGEVQADVLGEVRAPQSSLVEIRAGTDPHQEDALYRFRLVGLGDWSPESAEPRFKIKGAPVGTHRLLIAGFSPSGAWDPDTLSIFLRSEAAAGDEAASPGSGGTRPSRWVMWFPLVAGLGLGILAFAALSLMRAMRGRNGVPRGATVLTEPKAAAGAVEAAPVDEELRKMAREELESEIARLRKRIQDLLERLARLKKLNRELRDKCDFLEKSNVELRELRKRKDEFLAGVIHDLKNPAGAVQTLAEILQSYDTNNQEQARLVEEILSVSSRILRMTQELTDIMVSEVQEIPLNLGVDSIRPAILSVVQMNQAAARRKQIEIETIVPEGLPQLEMDTARIEEVLDNLISNAVKYSPLESSILVEARGTPSHLTIEVTDSGLGMSQKDIQDAFQFGKKLSARPTGEESSTGLGLWVVRRIVEAHRGLVWVRSKPGRGTTFSVQLPTRQTEG